MDGNAIFSKFQLKIICVLFLVLILVTEVYFFVPRMKKGNDVISEEVPIKEEVKEVIEPITTEEPVSEEIIYVKPNSNTNYELIGEKEEIITLDDKNYHLLAYYYKNKKLKSGVLKEIYFQDKLVADIHDATLVLGSGVTVSNFIEEDFINLVSELKYVNDTTTNDQYLAIYYNYDYYYKNRNDWIEKIQKIVLVNKNGDVLISGTNKDTKHYIGLWVDDTLDSERISYFNTNKKSKYNGKYSLYLGYDGNVEDAYYYELMGDSIYHVEMNDDKVIDYKYFIQNGVLNKEIVREISKEQMKNSVQSS